MEFLLFLEAKERLILELITEANYSVEENTPLCLLDKKYFGFFKKKQKRIVLCTQNAKEYTGYSFTKLVNNDDFNKTSIQIRRALRHEAVHVAQHCNNGKPILSKKDRNKKFNSFKLAALEGSTRFSSNKEKEIEAYSIEDKPDVVVKYIRKYCL